MKIVFFFWKSLKEAWSQFWSNIYIYIFTLMFIMLYEDMFKMQPDFVCHSLSCKQIYSVQFFAM